MGIVWHEDGPNSLYADCAGERFRLRAGDDGRIRLSTEDSACIFTWDDWTTAKSDATIAVAFRLFVYDSTTYPGWHLYGELKRRNNAWAYKYGDAAWRARYFDWRSEYFTRDENLAMYKIVAALPENATVEEVARAINRPMFGDGR